MDIVVTGAGNGIGKATTETLVEHGHQVTAVDIDEKGLGRLPQQAETVLLDVSHEPAVEAFFEDRSVDVLINNAGYQGLAAVEDTPPGEVANHFETNVYGMFNMTRHALPLLRENNGRIINISSMASQVTAPFWAAYTASKHAVNGFTETLRMEVAPFDVDVIHVEPGPIQTGFNKQGREKLKRYLPDSIYGEAYRHYLDKKTGGVDAGRAADVIVHAAETSLPQARYTVTWQAWLAPKIKAVTPRFVWEWLVRKSQTG